MDLSMIEYYLKKIAEALDTIQLYADDIEKIAISLNKLNKNLTSGEVSVNTTNYSHNPVI